MPISQLSASPERTPRSSPINEQDTLGARIGVATGTTRVLACVDDASSASAVAAHSLAVASSLGLEVTLGRVVESQDRFHSPADPIEWQLRNRRLRRDLERMAEECGLTSRQGSVLLVGKPAEEFSSWARQNGATLLAVASRDAREKAGLGSTAQRLLDRGDASLLLVPPMPVSGKVRYRHIMVPIDGSARAESVLPVAQRIARAHGSELMLVHVVPRVEIMDVAHTPHVRQLRQEIDGHNLRRARMHLDALRTRVQGAGLKARIITSGPADARSELRHIANHEDVDLVVMSSHGWTGLREVSCGSVTQYFALNCSAPLLIVRPNLVCGSRQERRSSRDAAAFNFE